MEENHYREAVCPACGIIDRFGDKWSLRILVLLQKNGTMRFNELMRNGKSSVSCPLKPSDSAPLC